MCFVREVDQRKVAVHTPTSFLYEVDMWVCQCRKKNCESNHTFAATIREDVAYVHHAWFHVSPRNSPYNKNMTQNLTIISMRNHLYIKSTHQQRCSSIETAPRWNNNFVMLLIKPLMSSTTCNHVATTSACMFMNHTTINASTV